MVDVFALDKDSFAIALYDVPSRICKRLAAEAYTGSAFDAFPLNSFLLVNGDGYTLHNKASYDFAIEACDSARSVDTGWYYSRSDALYRAMIDFGAVPPGFEMEESGEPSPPDGGGDLADGGSVVMPEPPTPNPPAAGPEVTDPDPSPASPPEVVDPAPVDPEPVDPAPVDPPSGGENGSPGNPNAGAGNNSGNGNQNPGGNGSNPNAGAGNNSGNGNPGNPPGQGIVPPGRNR